MQQIVVHHVGLGITYILNFTLADFDRVCTESARANDYFIPQTMLLLHFHTPNY